MKTQIKDFCLATGQRVVRSFAAAELAIITVDAAHGGGLLDVDWSQSFSVSGLTATITLLLCIAGGAQSGNGPSFGSVETTTSTGDRAA